MNEPLVPYSVFGVTIRKNDEAMDIPGCRPMHRMAARTVWAVVLVAPATEPSASPSRTMRSAKKSGSSMVLYASSRVMPLALRRS